MTAEPSLQPVTPTVRPTLRPVGGTAFAAAPELTVVLCTSGRRPEELRRCLASLANLADAHVEVVVVDNARERRLHDVAVPRNARVTHEPRRGLDFARNAGVAAATAPIVAFIDDDCEATPDWARSIIDAFTDPDVACVTGRVLAANTDRETARCFEARFSFDRGPEPMRFVRADARPWYPTHPWQLGTGCNMAFRRDVLDRLGGFDPALDMGSLVGGGGDLDVFRRLLDADEVAVYEPFALIRHFHRGTFAALGWQFFGYGATVTALAAKGALTRRGERRRSLAFVRHYIRDEIRRVRQRRFGHGEVVPLRMFACEFAGHLWGPVGYLLGTVQARVRARS